MFVVFDPSRSFLFYPRTTSNWFMSHVLTVEIIISFTIQHKLNSIFQYDCTCFDIPYKRIFNHYLIPQESHAP